MKILLISDTHGIVSKLKDEVLPMYAGEVQMVVHLGDYAVDLYRFRPQYPSLEIVGVGGSFENETAERVLEVGSDVQRRILIMHGHTMGVKTDLSRIAYYAQEKGVDACFFGHTHESTTFTKNGIFFMNPGSLSQPRNTTKGTFGLVTIAPDGQITGEVVAT